MRSTGLKKCRPAKFSGLATAWAMRVIEIVEVFDARMASGGRSFCSSPIELRLDLLVLDDRLDDDVAVGQRRSRSATVLSWARAPAISAGVMRPISMRALHDSW